MHELDTPLLPCPFCGGEAEFEYRDWNEKDDTGDDGTGRITCSGCFVSTQIDTEDILAEVWNKRSRKKLYVCFDEDYEDFTLIAAFDDRILAEKFCKKNDLSFEEIPPLNPTEEEIRNGGV